MDLIVLEKRFPRPLGPREILSLGTVQHEEPKVSKGPRVVNFFLPRRIGKIWGPALILFFLFINDWPRRRPSFFV